MDLNKYKEVKLKKFSERDKILLIGIVMLILVAVFIFLNSDRFKSEETGEVKFTIIPTSTETRKELFIASKKTSNENTISFVRAKIISLQFELNKKGQTLFSDRISKLNKLHDSSDKTLVLAELNSVIKELLKYNICFLFPGSTIGTLNYINFAAKRGLISKSEKKYLARIKQINTLHCFPLPLNNAEQIEQDIHKGLLIIENLI